MSGFARPATLPSPPPLWGRSDREAIREGGNGDRLSNDPPPRPSPTRGEGEESARRFVIELSATSLIADPSGALYWPEHGLLVVSDLHLEKGSSFARRGMLLPPYDTAATLARLTKLVAHYAPRVVIALGDSFHDGGGPLRLSVENRDSIAALQRGRGWVWITGNHDPDPADGIGGVFKHTLTIDALTFRHLPTGAAGEIAGHLHPVAKISQRGRVVRRRCFVADPTRMVMPAFGAFTGGLNVRDAAFADLFGTLSFTAHMLGPDRLYAFAAKRCIGD